MLEWILTVGAAELAKVGLEQLLKLGQTAAEDYVKDFFKGCLKEGVAAAKPEVAKKAVAGALKAFLLLVTDELEDQDLSKADIRDRYDPALIQFVQNELVKPILGKAFEKDCVAIDIAGLATTWQQSTVKGEPFPALPQGFDWQRVGSEYLKKVRRIVRESAELRSLLETELLEEIARNTAQISPGFDVVKYRASLQTSYGALKLHEIDCTDQQYRMKLWNLFIEPTVRQAMPPSRYELPIDLQRRFHAEEPAELSEENLEHYRRDYFEKSPEKVLKALADAHHAVILGDPGAGKSTLLQYLALAWVESQKSEFFENSDFSERLPLLIELREYVIARSPNFLEFLHSGRGVDWQFDQQQLHQYLQEHPTLVMFDGLDEVFDRATQAAIIDDIIRFAGQYPQSKILITSRVIGYSPEKLQQAEFRHFTIQPLDPAEIHQFIDRWYDLAMGSDLDKERLKQRLKDAIANSKAIQNLADNPLLLTMMAILNRRQELPRDRAELYDQASRVLLHNWDVDHKRLKLPLDTIGRREKQEMLRLVAYEMQAGEDGLKGNAIDAGRLTQVLTDYLKDQGFSEPREKANLLIDQLRHRNFILCDRGGDIYGFVHRTFLEYFCAVEIVHRFEKQRTLTFEQLRDEVFGQHWQEETWHEVLCLVIIMLGEKVSANVLTYLIEQDDASDYDEHLHFIDRDDRPKFFNLYLAANCLKDVLNQPSIKPVAKELLDKLKYLAMSDLGELTSVAVLEAISTTWRNDLDTLYFLKTCAYESDGAYAPGLAVSWIAKYWAEEPDTLTWLKAYARSNELGNFSAIVALANGWKNDPETLTILKLYAQSNEHLFTKTTVIKAIIQGWKDQPDTIDFLSNVVINDPFKREVMREAGNGSFIHETFHGDVNPRKTALEALLTHYSTHPKTLELLRDRATNDPDEQLRQWAQEQLKVQNEKLKMEEVD
ncbi:MAG: NTPase (NACHT family) [Leptolyngbya sp.]|nr:MAG: NTPase (NACHT family) [Leptolyngbya sp.]